MAPANKWRLRARVASDFQMANSTKSRGDNARVLKLNAIGRELRRSTSNVKLGALSHTRLGNLR